MLKYTGSRLVGNTFASEFGQGTIDPKTGVVTGIPKDKEKAFKDVRGFVYEEDAKTTASKTANKPATSKPATKKATTAPKTASKDKEDK